MRTPSASTGGGRVEISVSFDGDGARVRFADDGIGMEPDQLERALAGFHQVEHFLTRREGGLGIGLATARRIVEGHGGRLDASSRAGKGSEFTVTLPESGHEPHGAALENPALQ